MDSDFRNQIKDFLFTMLLLCLGAAIGFYVLPSFVHSKQMDRISQLSFIEGRYSVVSDLLNSTAIVREKDIQIFPDTSSTFYFVIRKGN